MTQWSKLDILEIDCVEDVVNDSDAWTGVEWYTIHFVWTNSGIAKDTLRHMLHQVYFVPHQVSEEAVIYILKAPNNIIIQNVFSELYLHDTSLVLQ